jgi:hypothetical protein
MAAFITWLLFGASVPLTTQPIDLTPSCVTLVPKSKMVVRGDGATIAIELPYESGDHWPDGIIDRLHKIALDYPTGRITARAYRENGTAVTMGNN